jgi:hypothetical protein
VAVFLVALVVVHPTGLAMVVQELPIKVTEGAITRAAVEMVAVVLVPPVLMHLRQLLLLLVGLVLRPALLVRP